MNKKWYNKGPIDWDEYDRIHTGEPKASEIPKHHNVLKDAGFTEVPSETGAGKWYWKEHPKKKEELSVHVYRDGSWDSTAHYKRDYSKPEPMYGRGPTSEPWGSGDDHKDLKKSIDNWNSDNTYGEAIVGEQKHSSASGDTCPDCGYKGNHAGYDKNSRTRCGRCGTRFNRQEAAQAKAIDAMMASHKRRGKAMGEEFIDRLVEGNVEFEDLFSIDEDEREWSRRRSIPHAETKHMPFGKTGMTSVVSLQGKELGSKTVTGKGKRMRTMYSLPKIDQ